MQLKLRRATHVQISWSCGILYLLRVIKPSSYNNHLPSPLGNLANKNSTKSLLYQKITHKGRLLNGVLVQLPYDSLAIGTTAYSIALLCQTIFPNLITYSTSECDTFAMTTLNCNNSTTTRWNLSNKVDLKALSQGFKTDLSLLNLVRRLLIYRSLKWSWQKFCRGGAHVWVVRTLAEYVI